MAHAAIVPAGLDGVNRVDGTTTTALVLMSDAMSSPSESIACRKSGTRAVDPSPVTRT